MFASCPHELSSCTEMVHQNATVGGGGNVSFNATVIHTSGGSCGFVQEITRVTLKKKIGTMYDRLYQFSSLV